MMKTWYVLGINLPKLEIKADSFDNAIAQTRKEVQRMFKWEEITEEEFSTLFDVCDYQYSSTDGDTDFYKVEISHNENFIGAIKEIEKVNRYYLLIKR